MPVSATDFAGLWVDALGRILVLEVEGEDGFISVYPSKDGAATAIDLLDGKRTTERMKGEFGTTKKEGNLILTVEAGTPGLGPTYQLEWVDGRLIPHAGMGLYDDYDDDLGMPWAFPLLPWSPKG